MVKYWYSGDGQTRLAIDKGTSVQTVNVDAGKEAVLTEPNTNVDYEKGELWFKCQGCHYFVRYVGDVKIPKGGMCASCSGDREWIRQVDNCGCIIFYLNEINYYGNAPAFKDVDEELSKQRADIAREREDLKRKRDNLEAWGRDLEKQKAQVRDYLANIHQGTAESVIRSPRLNLPAWVRDALWGMGLSGIGLAFAWVATLIF